MNHVPLYRGERIDDLLTHDLRVIQSDEVFSFSMDAVLLARFCSVPAKGSILDLCSGNGVIPILLTTRTKARIVGIEIQDKLFDMAVRNVRMNRLEDQIEMILGDLRQYRLKSNRDAFDLVVANPPYLPVDSGDLNENEHLSIARHEVKCTLEDVIKASSQLVRSRGKVAMIHRPARLADMIMLMRQYRLEPKRIRFVHPRQNEEANMVLIEAMKDGRPEIRLLPPLIVYNENEQYCEELLKIYYPMEEQEG